MAQAKNTPPPTEAPEEEAPKPKKKGKLLVILIALILLGGGGGGVYYFLVLNKAKDPKASHQTEKKEEKPPIYAQLGEELTARLLSEGGDDAYLQVKIEMEVADESVKERIKLFGPKIRHALLLLMSSKTNEELRSIEGKERLAKEMASQINKVIGSVEPAKNGVLGVNFTAIVIQ